MPEAHAPATVDARISPIAYAVVAPALLLAQNGAVALAYHARGLQLEFDALFALIPLRRLLQLPQLEAWQVALAILVSFLIWWAVAHLSLARAGRSGFGRTLAAFSFVPGLQYIVVSVLAVLPTRIAAMTADEAPGAVHVVQGVLAGIAIIVAAVLVSALALGAYGWGLFVMTPFFAGLATAYLANRKVLVEFPRTIGLVLMAGLLGALALLMLALEGFLCILVIAPLAAFVAVLGGFLGRAIAAVRIRRRNPLPCLAILPAIFMLEGAMPPAAAIDTRQSIHIAAPPSAVWDALVSPDRIESSPGWVAWAGLAFPIRGQLLGQGAGAERIGEFSTGIARERIVRWEPGRAMGFTVQSQPPAMEEMSPYRRVHAPHVSGYFDTLRTDFELRPVAGGTRLTVSAGHVLRIEPIPYWEPIARWAIASNTTRVLDDIRRKAERRREIG